MYISGELWAAFRLFWIYFAFFFWIGAGGAMCFRSFNSSAIAQFFFLYLCRLSAQSSVLYFVFHTYILVFFSRNRPFIWLVVCAATGIGIYTWCRVTRRRYARVVIFFLCKNTAQPAKSVWTEWWTKRNSSYFLLFFFTFRSLCEYIFHGAAGATIDCYKF